MSKELLLSVTLADCDVQTKRGHGKGGQNRNTRDTAVRIVHRASGAVGESQEERSQLQNKRTAFKRMAHHPKMKIWLNREIWIRTGLPSPEMMADKAMQPQNIKVEVRKDGKWISSS